MCSFAVSTLIAPMRENSKADVRCSLPWQEPRNCRIPSAGGADSARARLWLRANQTGLTGRKPFLKSTTKPLGNKKETCGTNDDNRTSVNRQRNHNHSEFEPAGVGSGLTLSPKNCANSHQLFTLNGVIASNKIQKMRKRAVMEQ
jgi:hypothetical protein